MERYEPFFFLFSTLNLKRFFNLSIAQIFFRPIIPSTSIQTYFVNGHAMMICVCFFCMLTNIAPSNNHKVLFLQNIPGGNSIVEEKLHEDFFF